MAMATSKTIKIDVISDFLCPWCYIGHLDLERGIELARAAKLPVNFVVQYHPFILNPSLSGSEAVTKKEYFEKKLGVHGAAQMKELIARRGEEEGIKFAFGGVVRSSALAHRLLTKAYLVGGQTLQLPLLKALFRSYFEVEQDIGDPATLASLAVEEGVFADEEKAKAWLEGDELDVLVKKMSADAMRKGVTGVPFTVIDGKWAVSGSQKPECYFKIFNKLSTSDTLQSPRIEPKSMPTAAATA